MSESLSASSAETPFNTGHRAELQRLLSQDQEPAKGNDITQTDIDQWLDQMSDGELYDRQISLRRNGHDEVVTVDDAVYARTQGPNGEERHPIVIVRYQDGHTEDLPAKEFLHASGFNLQQFRAEQHDLQESSAAEARQYIAEQESTSYDQAIHELERQDRRNRIIFAHDQSQTDESSHVVTISTHRAAEKNLQSVLADDEDAAAIIRTYQTAHPNILPDPMKLVDAIHDDDELRVSLGNHFLNLVDHMPMDQMPSRVLSNEEKSPAFSRFPIKVRSREYVALLG